MAKHPRFTRCAAGLVGLALVVLSTACGSGDDAEEAGTDEPDTGSEQGCTSDQASEDLSVATFVAPRGLDPVTAASSGRTGAIELATIYDTLMRYDPGTGEVEPQVAESLAANDANDQWTLTLRSDVHFGNGDLLTADTVKTSIERHQSDDARLASLASVIADMTVMDDQTVVFDLTQSWAGFPFVLAGPIGMIVNPAVLEERGVEGFQTDPQGAGVGPFELMSYAQDEELVVEGRDDYWGGPVCIGTLRFTTISSAATAYDSFSNDEVQVAFLQDPVVAERARSESVDNFGFVYGAGRAVLMNAGVRGGQPPTADVRVRQAIAAALDPDLIDQRTTEGTGRPTSALFDDEMVSSPDVDGPALDPDEARRLVSEVKAEGQWDGTIRLVCPELAQEAAITIEGLLNDVGFQTALEVVDTAALTTRVIVDANFDLACWQFNVNDLEPWVELEAFQSTSDSNRGGVSSEELDRAIPELLTAATLDDRKAILADIQEAWNETVPAALYGSSEDVIVWKPEVEGLRFSSSSLVTFEDAVVAG
jgi:peptide/nickel transport system substrate-binding protein